MDWSAAEDDGEFSGVEGRLQLPRYKMNADPRGICVIFNNARFSGKNKEAYRKGTAVDRGNLHETFERLGFIVEIHEDCTAQEILEEMQVISDRDHSAYDCFVCCILSHGARGAIHGSDWVPIKIEDLIKQVLPDKCSSLGGKPKLFFVQACQGDSSMAGFKKDADPESQDEPEFTEDSEHNITIPNEADVMVSHSTMPGYVAFRHEDEGSWYIGELTELLNKYAKFNDIGVILRGLNNRVGIKGNKKSHKQAPVCMDALRKLLIFTGDDINEQRRTLDALPKRSLDARPRVHVAMDTGQAHDVLADRPGKSILKHNQKLLQMVDKSTTKGEELTALIGDAAREVKIVAAAAERARLPVAEPAPKAGSFDTVLCLDTSESMKTGGAFEEMIKFVNDFLAGVEEIVKSSGVEEDIALVTFGGGAKVVQHLTNDFARIREAVGRIKPGGKSPFFEAVMVCHATIAAGGGRVSMSGVYDVNPRIIFITDGHITESSDDPTSPDKASDPANTRGRFSRLMMELNPETPPVVAHPIVFVPVGTDADKELLESLSTLNQSSCVEPRRVKKLCGYFRVQETIGKVLVTLQDKEKERMKERDIKALANVLGPGLDESDKMDVVRAVREELNRPKGQKKEKFDPSNFDYVHENTERVQRGEGLPLGTRVVRGPDWTWEDQDGHGPGTVIHNDEGKNSSIWVMWDTGKWNCYTFDHNIGYDVWKTDEHPRLKTEKGELEIGMTVKRGMHGTDRGAIIRKSMNGKKVKVRWQSGKIQECFVRDLIYSDLFGVDVADTRKRAPDEEEIQVDVEQAEDMGDGKPAWQWQDNDGNWQNYPPQTVQELEKAYQIKNDGSCIIQRDGKNSRVFFENKVEKAVGARTGSARDVRRVFLQMSRKRKYSMPQGQSKFPASQTTPSSTRNLDSNLKDDPQQDADQAPTVMSEDMAKPEDKAGGMPAWQWEDGNGVWRDYPSQTVQDLEKAYQKNKSGSCIFQLSGSDFRVTFESMKEKAVGKQGGMLRSVRRLSPSNIETTKKGEEPVAQSSS